MRFYKNDKKSAMFGIDARIALAIFGALSIITGAVLYSTLNKLESTTLIQELNELMKAYDSYYIDTRSEITSITSNIYLDIIALKENGGKKNWKGPYTNLDFSATHANHSLFGNYKYLMGLFLDGTWDSDCQKNRCNGGIVGGECYMWAGVFNLEDDSLLKQIDKEIDKTIDSKNGNVRYYTILYEGKTYHYGFIKFRKQYL